MLTACLVAHNEALLVADAIRSVAAYVDRFVVVDCAFSTNPAEGPVGSSDGQRGVVEQAVAGKPLVYIEPPERLEEQDARNLYLEQLALGEFGLVIDADEILIGSYVGINAMIESGFGFVGPDVGIRVYTTAVLFNGYADEMDRRTYDSAPVITTYGWQPRIVRGGPGLRYQRDLVGLGRYTHSALWRGHKAVGDGRFWSEPVILNRHVAQPFEGYLADFAWEIAQRDGAR